MSDTTRFDGPATMPSNEQGWWEDERSKFIDARVRELVAPGALIADVGCGRGSVFGGTIDTDHTVVRIDSHPWAEWADRRGIYVCAAADALPFRDETFDLVASFDVLEHLGDDTVALREQRRLVRSGGHVVATVPADERLWSAHDDNVGHQRRYTAPAARGLGAASGLSAHSDSYFFSFLWLPAWLTRRSPLRTSEPGSGSGWLSRMVRSAIAFISALERKVAGLVRIPFGTSLWVAWTRDGGPRNPASETDTTAARFDPRRVLATPWIYEGFQRSVGKDKLRQRFVEQYVQPRSGDVVVDIGCGPGDLFRHLPDVTYIGFDVSAAYIQSARARFGSDATFVAGDLEDLRPELDAPVDLVVTVGVLHHVPDAEAVRIIQFAQDVLRPGGRFVSLEPHLFDAQNVIAKRLILADRGDHVRPESEYAALCQQVFEDTVVVRDDDMLRIPYSVVVLTCTKTDGAQADDPADA
jgi:SAM-dependent methyltransferase